jgi:hypothetical protein
MAGSDVENMGKAAVFLLQSNDLVPMNRLSGASGTEDEHDPHAVYLYVLEERRPHASLKEIEVFSFTIRRIVSSSSGELRRGGPFAEGLGSRWFTERFHRNGLVTHFEHGQVFCPARRFENYAVTRCRLHQRAPQR